MLIIFFRRFLIFFGGGLFLSLVPLIVAANSEDGRGWHDVLYTGPLILVAVGLAAGALLEAAIAHCDDAWMIAKISAILCAAAVVLGGSMLYEQFSDNDLAVSVVSESAAGGLEGESAVGTIDTDSEKTKARVANISYVVTAGSILAGVGSTLVASHFEVNGTSSGRRRQRRTRKSKSPAAPPSQGALPSPAAPPSPAASP